MKTKNYFNNGMDLKNRTNKKNIEFFVKFSFAMAMLILTLSSCLKDEDEDEGGGNRNELINGGWYLNLSSGTAAQITINGSNATVSDRFDVSCLNPMITWVSAVGKNIIVIGTPYLKNIKSKGNNQWSCLMMAIQYNSIPEATGLQYLEATLTLSNDNNEIYLSFDNNPTFRAAMLSKAYINNGCSGSNNSNNNNNNNNGNNGGNTSGYGSITFWTASDHGCGKINITVTGVGSGTLSNYFTSGTPDCGANGTVTFSNVKYGSYSWKANCSSYTWSGTINLANGCAKMKLN